MRFLPWSRRLGLRWQMAAQTLQQEKFKLTHYTLPKPLGIFAEIAYFYQPEFLEQEQFMESKVEDMKLLEDIF